MHKTGWFGVVRGQQGHRQCHHSIQRIMISYSSLIVIIPLSCTVFEIRRVICRNCQLPPIPPTSVYTVDASPYNGSVDYTDARSSYSNVGDYYTAHVVRPNKDTLQTPQTVAENNGMNQSTPRLHNRLNACSHLQHATLYHVIKSPCYKVASCDADVHEPQACTEGHQ